MKAREKRQRRHPPEAVVGPLTVVDPEPGGGEGAQLRDKFKEVRVQHLRSIAPIEAFDVRVLIRFPRLDVVRGHAVLRAPIDEGLRGEFRAVADADRGRPSVERDELVQGAHDSPTR